MKSIIFILGGLFLLLSISCKKGGRCEESPTIYQSSITVDFKDAVSGKYLYAEYFPFYEKDSLIVLAPNNQSLIILSSLNQIPNTSDRYWVLNFGNLFEEGTDKGSFSAEICKNYIIKYTYNESDTLKVCFKSRNTSCGSVFETLKVYDNSGILLGSATDATSAHITVTKK